MNTTRITTLAVFASLLACTTAFAKVSVYLKDGSELEAQRAWTEGDKVQVLVNRDTLVDLDANEVDLQKSKIQVKVQKKLVDEVIEVGGTRKQLEKMLKSSGSDDEFDKVLQESYSVAQAERVVRTHFSRKLDEKTLAKVLEWLKSPTGRKIIDAESTPDPERVQKKKTFLDREAASDMAERIKLLQEIESSTGISELQIHLAERMFRRLAKATPENVPRRAEILEKVYSGMPSREEIRKQNLENSAYTLRDLSLEELREYQHFLTSAAGKKYNAATLDAAAEIIGKVMDKLGVELGKKVAELATSVNDRESTESASEICSATAKEASRQLPLKMDAVTTAMSIACESTTLVYAFKIQNMSAAEFNLNLAEKKAIMRSSICSNETVVEGLIKKGLSIQYSYFDASGKLMQSFKLIPSDCEI